MLSLTDDSLLLIVLSSRASPSSEDDDVELDATERFTFFLPVGGFFEDATALALLFFVLPWSAQRCTASFVDLFFDGLLPPTTPPIIFPDRVVIPPSPPPPPPPPPPHLGSGASFGLIFVFELDLDFDSPAHSSILILSAKYLDGNLLNRNFRYSGPNSSSLSFPRICFGI